MLFSILHIGSHVYQATSKDMAGSPSSSTRDLFHTRAGQALVTGGYNKARPYSVEATLLYGISKFAESKDRDSPAWMIMGVTARLAMRMGYHRDSRHLPAISLFEGEMRRRVWMLVETFDLLLSSQSGIPAIIHEDDFDTEPPGNLFDTDFDENSTVIPPSRPPTDPTPMLYYCFKARVAKMSRRVIGHALSLRPQPYGRTLELDSELHVLHEETPPSLQVRPLSSSIIDEAYMILWRMNIELLYQRSLCILHREHLSQNRSESFFDYSRDTCTGAALRILDLQAELYSACQPGGHFCNDQWMLSNVVQHDFCIAAMLICLDLYEAKVHPTATSSPNSEGSTQKLNALKHTHKIWTSRGGVSREASRAAKILTTMLSKLEVPVTTSTNTSALRLPPSTTNGAQWTDQSTTSLEALPIDMNAIDLGGYQGPIDANTMESLDTFFNNPDNIDWVSLPKFLCCQCLIRCTGPNR